MFTAKFQCFNFSSLVEAAKNRWQKIELMVNTFNYWASYVQFHCWLLLSFNPSHSSQAMPWLINRLPLQSIKHSIRNCWSVNIICRTCLKDHLIGARSWALHTYHLPLLSQKKYENENMTLLSVLNHAYDFRSNCWWVEGITEGYPRKPKFRRQTSEQIQRICLWCSLALCPGPG